MAFVYPSYLLSMPLLQYCIYLWSKQNPSAPRSFWGITVKGFYMPFVLMAFSLLVGSSIVENIIGILTGHVFYYFSQVCEATKNTPLFTTPAALYCFLVRLTHRRRLLSLPTATSKEDEVFKRRWGGSGHRLGVEWLVSCRYVVIIDTSFTSTSR